MNTPYRPLSPFPPAVFRALGRLALRVAALEQKASEARTRYLRHADLAAHPATRRLLDELEFLHASHARALRLHASHLDPASSSGSADEFAASSEEAAYADGDLEEILIATYEQLNLLAAHYTRLHTLAVACEHQSIADLSLDHLKAITPKVMMCSQAIPAITAEGALRRFGNISYGCAENALETTQAAWKNDTQFPAST